MIHLSFTTFGNSIYADDGNIEFIAKLLNTVRVWARNFQIGNFWALEQWGSGACTEGPKLSSQSGYLALIRL